MEADYITCIITECGSITWFRISDNLRKTLKKDVTYNPFKPSVRPKYNVYRRINITNTTGIVFKYQTDGQVTITPFGADMTEGTAINVSKFFITK